MTNRSLTAQGIAALACVAWPFLALGWLLWGPESVGQDYLRHFIPQSLWYRYHDRIGVEALSFGSAGTLTVPAGTR